MTEKKFKVSENMLMWAFRYSLHRRTGAVDSVVIHLKEHWKDLELYTQKQIKREIREGQRETGVGLANFISEEWIEILNLKEK